MRCHDCKNLERNKYEQFAKENICKKYNEGISNFESYIECSCKGFEFLSDKEYYENFKKRLNNL